VTRLDLSLRADDRILKVSRTIADLESFAKIRSLPVGEAVGYRSLFVRTEGEREFGENVAAAEEIQYLLGRVRQRRASSAASHPRRGRSHLPRNNPVGKCRG
jgi:hypothetical protein